MLIMETCERTEWAAEEYKIIPSVDVAIATWGKYKDSKNGICVAVRDMECPEVDKDYDTDGDGTVIEHGGHFYLMSYIAYDYDNVIYLRDTDDPDYTENDLIVNTDYCIKYSESEELIETCACRADAVKAVREREKEDKENGTFKPYTYDIFYA